MERRIVFVIFLVVVQGELFPSFDLQRPSEAYLADDRYTVADCALRNFKLGGSTLTSAAAVAEVFFTEFPHLAALGSLDGNETLWKCSGSLITPNNILTSADCADKSLSVARLGDFDLNDPADDKYVQEFEIVNTILHQSVALLQLNASIEPHPTVIPACVWTADEFKFDALKRGTWSMEKMEMESKIETRVDCLENAENARSTTFCTNCTLETEDFGRTLEVHLYAQHKMVPFLLGMALTKQSKYTKLAPYIPWIERTVGASFSPTDCALRDIEYRQFDPEYFVNKNFSYSYRGSNETSAFVGIVPRTFVVTTSPKNHKVRIVDDLNNDGLECSGSIIEKGFVLTTASCIKLFSNGPNAVITAWQDVLGVAKVHVHPEHKLIYNDIALIRLSNLVMFNESAQFACPWPLDIIPSRLNSYGFGPQSLNVYGKDPKIIDLSIKSNVISTNNCNSQLRAASKWPISMVTNNEVCVGNPQYLVPSSCKMKLGSPLSRAAFYHNKYFPFVFGLGTFGEDCGFGSTPVVATKVARHIRWIDSIVFPGRKEVTPRDIELTKACYAQNAAYRHNFTEYSNDINNPNQATMSSSLALIGGESSWTCDGVIVHREFLLTSASCAKNASKALAGATLNNTDQQMLDIKNTFFHPEGILALIRTTPITFSLSVSPACLWFNTTHLPFFLTKPLWDFRAEKATHIQMHAMSHDECQGTEKVSDFCAGYQFPVSCEYTDDDVYQSTLCSRTNCDVGLGEILLSFEPTAQNKLTPVLVGLAATTNYCDLQEPMRFTRLSLYHDWIEAILGDH